MSTEFVMPTATTTTFNTSPTQYTLYTTRSQPISPVHSGAASPHGSSPVSPRSTISHLPQHTRQLRPPKSPLYVPAVLRPTEPPRRIRTMPSTPPKSGHNSSDSLVNLTHQRRRSIVNSVKNGLSQITEVEFSVQGLGRVTDTPTRKHWKPDYEASICDETTCQRYFSYFNRRHHCRRCGNIFCNDHSSHAIPLDQDANYHPYGARSRACEYCFSEYKGWEIARSSRSNSESSEDAGQPGTPTTPNVACAVGSKLGGVFGKAEHGPAVGASKGGSQLENMGASVPKDWNWSTF